MVLKMKDTNSACLSAVPHVPHLAKFLMPFYKCWAGAGWQQCKRPFLTQGVGRWFQRYWFFESGFCPDCVWFLPFRPPLLTNEMTHVLLPFMPSTECSDLDSGNPNLVFKLSQYLDTTTYYKIQPTSPYSKLSSPRRACALRALGLLLADGAPTMGRGKTFCWVN